MGSTTAPPTPATRALTVAGGEIPFRRCERIPPDQQRAPGTARDAVRARLKCLTPTLNAIRSWNGSRPASPNSSGARPSTPDRRPPWLVARNASAPSPTTPTTSWQPTFAADGTCLGYRSSIRDIGDRKRAEDALVEERRLLTSIIAHIPCGVFWENRQFRYRGCNEAFTRSADVERPADIVGKTDYELAWDRDQADYFRACDRQVMEENQPLLNIEEVERQADGRQAILLTSKVPLNDADGR